MSGPMASTVGRTCSFSITSMLARLLLLLLPVCARPSTSSATVGKRSYGFTPASMQHCMNNGSDSSLTSSTPKATTITTTGLRCGSCAGRSVTVSDSLCQDGGVPVGVSVLGLQLWAGAVLVPPT